MSTHPGWPPNAEPPQPSTVPSDPQATQPLPPVTGTYSQPPGVPSGYGQPPAGPSGYSGGYGQPPAGPSKKLTVGIIIGAVVGIVLASVFIPKLMQPKVPPVAMPSGSSFDLPSLPSANTKPNPGPTSPSAQGNKDIHEGPVIKTIQPSELQTGDCPMFADRANSRTKIRLVDCQGPHTIEVFAQVTILEPTLPGNEAINKMAFQSCDKAFEEYIGIPHDKSLYGDYFYISPTEATWDSGDRTISCYVGGEDLVHQGLLKGIKK